MALPDMAQLPDPPLPSTVDLRNFPDMPIDVKGMRDGELAVKATGEEFLSFMMLSCASWHQLPAASLPDDDVQLASLAGFGRVQKEWKRVKPGAMRGWEKCSDGRLYHKGWAEQALKAWRAKLVQKWRTECARLKKEAQRAEKKYVQIEFDVWVRRVHPESMPFLSSGTGDSVPDDTPPTSPGQSPGVPRETASKGSEVNGRDCSSNQRFPTGSSTTTPAAVAKAEDVEPHVNPDALARILAHCELGKVSDAHADSAIIARWIEHGATATNVERAIAEARKSLPFPKPLRLGYIDAVIKTTLAQQREGDERARARERATREIIEESLAAKAKTVAMPADLKKQPRRPSSSEPQASGVLTARILDWAREQKIPDPERELQPYVRPFLEFEAARKDGPYKNQAHGFMTFMRFIAGGEKYPDLRSLAAIQREAEEEARAARSATLMHLEASLAH